MRFISDPDIIIPLGVLILFVIIYAINAIWPNILKSLMKNLAKILTHESKSQEPRISFHCPFCLSVGTTMDTQTFTIKCNCCGATGSRVKGKPKAISCHIDKTVYIFDFGDTSFLWYPHSSVTTVDDSTIDQLFLSHYERHQANLNRPKG